MAILKAHHIAIKARDFQASKKFYTEVLGLKVVGGFPGRDIIFIDLNGTTIELMGGGPEEFTKPQGGLTHLALEVDDVDQTVAELKAKGVTFAREPSSFEFGRNVFFTDPDGVALELFTSPTMHW